MNRRQVLTKAKMLINKDRDYEYGDATEAFRDIAKIWNVLIDTDSMDPISPQDVAMMMIAMKLVRIKNKSDHWDSWVDIAGYAALGAEASEKTNWLTFGEQR